MSIMITKTSTLYYQVEFEISATSSCIINDNTIKIKLFIIFFIITVNFCSQKAAYQFSDRLLLFYKINLLTFSKLNQ